MSKLWRSFLLAAFLLLAFALFGLLNHRVRGRARLLQLQSQLRAHGEKLSFAELLSKMPEHTNRLAATLTNSAASLSRPVPGNGAFRNYTGPGTARIQWLETSPVNTRLKPGGSFETWADFAHEVHAAQPALETLRQVLQDTTPDTHETTNWLMGPPLNFVAVRTAAQWFAASALDALHQHDLNRAASDLEALTSLAQPRHGRLLLVSQMICIAIANLDAALTWEALQHPGWNESQLECLQRAWESVTPLKGVEQGFTGERAFGIQLWLMLRNNTAAPSKILPGRSSPATPGSLFVDHVLLPVYKLSTMDDDEHFFLSNIQGTIETIRALESHQGWLRAQNQLGALTTNLNALASTPLSRGYWFSMAAIPNFGRAILTSVHAETEKNMVVTVLALKRYRVRHGQFPATLGALVPELLPELPFDPMSGGHLLYRLRSDGSYLLYSVGEDGIDNGGDPTPLVRSANDLWGARDAVWPHPLQSVDEK